MVNILTAFDDGCSLVGVVKGCVLVSPYDDIYPVEISDQFVSDYGSKG